MTETIWKQDSKKLALEEIDKYGQREGQLRKRLNELPEFAEWRSLKRPDINELEKEFLQKQREEFLSKHETHKLTEFSWLSNHDYHTDMKVIILLRYLNISPYLRKN